MKKVIVVSGPSGSGKSTVCELFVKKNPDYELVNSITTNKTKKGLDHYAYISADNFRLLERNGNFIESNMHSDNKFWFATPADEVTRIHRENKIPILEIDAWRRKQVLAKSVTLGFDVISIFLLSNADDIKSRLIKRGDSVESIIEQLEASQKEVTQCMSYDAVINNDNLEKTVTSIEEILKGNMGKMQITVNQYIAEAETIIRQLDDLDSVSALMLQVNQFCRHKGWDKICGPKDLAFGMTNRLLNLFWLKSDEQIKEMLNSTADREKIEEELAGTLFFLFRACTCFGFVPGQILREKLMKEGGES